MSQDRPTPRATTTTVGVLVGLLVSTTLALLTGAVPAYAAEALTVTKTASSDVLVGGVVDVGLTARNSGDRTEYNLTFRDQLPTGVTYVAGSSRPATVGEPTRVVVTGTPARQTLVWDNVSDLPVGAEQGITFKVRAAAAQLPVGSEYSNVGQAYANASPRTLPKFDAAGVYTEGATIQGTSNAATTRVTAITVDKSEPSPEHELLRGVHRHSTTYTLRVTNNDLVRDDDVVLVDYLPAQLELLGCGTADNTAAGAVEYPGAPRLDVSTPDVPGCVVPSSVETVRDPAGVPAGVYTRVEWRLGALTPAQVVTVRYRAGIPQRSNALAFPGATPSPGSLGQSANLDNNTGPSTRETTTEQSLVNLARVSATYTGPLAPGASTQVGDTDTLTVTAEDLAMQKSVVPGQFQQGQLATYTLSLQAGEYADTGDIVITDVIPNGLCPVDDVVNHAPGAPAECDPSAGQAPSLAYDSVTQNADGTSTVVFEPLAVDADGTATVTYRARMRSTYAGGSSAGAPTVTGDEFTNTVSLVARTVTRAGVNPEGQVAQEVRDTSSASLRSDTLVLDKRIQANGGPTPHTCATTPAGYADSASLTAAQTSFGEGSRVCFLLRIDFPAGNETRNAVLTDFLPDTMTYETGSAVAVDGNDVAATVTESDLTFRLGSTRAGRGTDRFVDRGATFLYRISAVVTKPPTTTPDVTGNLAKLTWVSTGGRVGFLRDREDFTLAPAPPVAVVKKARRLSPNPIDLADGSTAAAQRIRAGDVVAYTVTVTNNGSAANRNVRDVVGPDVWDRLPRGVTCADVSSVSDGGLCTDPGAASHPPFADRATRSVIRWDTPDSVVVGPAPAALALTYQVTYPATVAAGATYTNDVDVVSYGTTTNLGGVATHYPSTVDTRVTAAQVDAPRAFDNHTLRTPSSTMVKSNETSVDDATQGPDPGTVNYAAIGETVTYTVTTALPASTSVYSGVISDPAPAGVRYDAVGFEYRSGPAEPWGPLPSGWEGRSTTTTATVTLPPSPARVDTGAAEDQVRLTVTATLTDVVGNTHGSTVTNTATFTSRNEYGATLTRLAPTSSIVVAEPRPVVTKLASSRTPVAGQTVTFTVVARNTDSLRRPTLYDAVVVDCVPRGLTVVPGSPDPSTGTATVGAEGGDGCAADRTPVVWDVGDVPWAAESAPAPTLTYDVVVSPQAAGGAAYANTALLRGTSLDGATAGERTSSASTTETVVVPGSALSKTVRPRRLPVGGVATYDVSVVLPAQVNFYDATIVDQLPAGIDVDTVRRTGSACSYTDGGPADACSVAVTADLTSGARHGWSFGDVLADPRPRLVTITYTATVADVVSSAASTTLTNSALLRWNRTNTAGTPGIDDSFEASTAPGTADLVVTEPSLTVRKVVSSATPAPGVDFTYTVTVTNATGADVSAAHDVDLVDTVPAGVRVVGPISDGGSLADGSAGGGTITWADLGPIPAGASRELTYVARLVSPAPAAPQRNTVDVTRYTSLDDGGRVYDGPSATATVTPALPAVTVSKQVLDAAPAYVGEPTRWQIDVRNTGTATGYDVDVRDVLPRGWTYDVGSARVTVAGAPATQRDPVTGGSPVQTLTWDDLGDLGVGETITLVLTATPGSSLTSDQIGRGVAQVNRATATAQDLEGPTGAVVTTGAGDAQTRIDKADLTLDKTVAVAPVAGRTVSWRLAVANDGPDTAVGPFEVVDTLPADVSFVSAGGTGWACTAQDRTVTCGRAATSTLASRSSLPVITVTALVPADLAPGTTVVNTATVGARTYETDQPDNTDTERVDVTVVSDLGVAKDLPGTLVPGERAAYTLDVTNHGPSVSRGPIVVTDTLPAGLTFVGFTGAGWELTRSGQALTFTRSDTSTPVAVGALPRITVTVAVETSVTTDVTNTAAVSEPTDPTSGREEPDSSTTTDAPEPRADLSLTKESPGAFRAGTTDDYLFTVHDLGPSDAAGPITITDTLPGSLTYVSSASTDGWTCTASGQDVTCVLPGGLRHDQVSALRLTVDIDQALTGSVVNEAEVSGRTPDPNPGNDSASDDTGITAESDLQMVKTLVTSPVVAGQDVTYTLAVRNDGPSTSPGPITVTDTLASSLTFVSATGAGWDCPRPLLASPQLVTCTRAGTLGDDQSAGLITLVATVASDAGATTLSNSANVDGPATDPAPTNDTGDAGTAATVTEEAELELTKSVRGTDPVKAGEDATFDITVRNTGSSDARSVRVVDTLPEGMTLVSAGGVGWECVVRTSTCTLQRALAGRSSAAPITVVATVSSATPDGTTLNNEATVSTATPGDTTSGNTDDADVDVAAEADLQLVKQHATQVATAGLPTTYTIQVSNLGPSDAVGPLTVTDTLPEGMTFLSAATPWDCETDRTGTDVTCTLPAGLAADATATTLELQVQVAAGTAGGSRTNTATVDSPTSDPRSANDTGSVDVEVVEVADVAVVKSHVGPVRVGDPLTFTLQVANTGPSTARGVVVTDTLPVGLDFVSAEGEGWTCAEADRLVTCTLDGVLDPGVVVAPVSLVTTVRPAAYPSVDNTGEVSTTTADLDPDDNTDTDPIAVPALVDLRIAKSHRGQLVVGDRVTYELVVTNDGPTAAPGPTVVQDTLPAGLSPVSAAGPDAVCAAVGQTVTCTRTSPLAAGESTTIELVADVLPTAWPGVTNVATVRSPSEEVGGGDNTDDDIAPVRPTVALGLTKEVASLDDKGAVYLLTVANAGPNATVGPIRLRDPLPEGLRLVSASGDGWSCVTAPRLLSCVHADPLPAGESSQVRLTTAFTAAAGSEVVNVARLSAGGSVTPSEDEATLTVPDGPDPSAPGDSAEDGFASLLPTTGGPALWVGLAGLLAILAGALVLVTRRRRSVQGRGLGV